MNDKLPHVFANRVGSISNNKRVYYSDLERRERKKEDSIDPVIDKYNLRDTVKKNDIRTKIIELFKSPNNVYKVKANIKINGKIITKYLIGRTNSSLITLDDELISINEIEDINEA